MNFKNEEFKIIKPILFLTAISAFSLTIFFGLNYSGFCFSEMGYLSDKKKIKLFFDLINSKDSILLDNPNYSNNTKSNYIKIKPYKSFEEYIKKYPDCCGVNIKSGYDIPPPELLDRIFGYDSGDVVSVNYYAIKKDMSSTEKTVLFKFEERVQNCGMLLD